MSALVIQPIMAIQEPVKYEIHQPASDSSILQVREH